MVRMFANGPDDRGSTPSQVIPKIQKWYLLLPGLIFSITGYGSWVSEAIQGKELHPLLLLGVIVIKRGALGRPRPRSANNIYIYIYIYIYTM